MSQAARWKWSFLLGLFGGGLLSVAPFVLERVSFHGGFEVYLILVIPGDTIARSLPLDRDSRSFEIALWLGDWFFWACCIFVASWLLQTVKALLLRHGDGR